MGRYAIKTPTQHTSWEEMLRIWRAADEMEVFESAWNWDHLYPLRGDPHGSSLEAWTTLAALAQATERIRLGCMVTGMHFRHPAITASMAASLDIISAGRSYLGLGAGWFEEEAEANGIDLGTLRQRMDRFDEGLEVIVSLLSNEETTFTGSYYQLSGARCEPKPVQRPHPPIVIGGTGRNRTLRSVARWAQMWDALRADHQEWLELREILHGYCEEIGRDPASITCSVHVTFGPEDDPAQVADTAVERLAGGVDVVVFSMTSPYHLAMVEGLAGELSKRDSPSDTHIEAPTQAPTSR
jgi:F420-dependent oxidoreductase-like protein